MDEMSSSEKYKAFRNFMVNELGITRQDIEAWTKEAVEERVGKAIASMSNKGITGVVEERVKSTLADWRMRDEIQKAIKGAVPPAIAEIVQKQLVVSVKLKGEAE